MNFFAFTFSWVKKMLILRGVGVPEVGRPSFSCIVHPPHTHTHTYKPRHTSTTHTHTHLHAHAHSPHINTLPHINTRLHIHTRIRTQPVVSGCVWVCLWTGLCVWCVCLFCRSARRENFAKQGRGQGPCILGLRAIHSTVYWELTGRAIVVIFSVIPSTSFFLKK